MATRMSLFSPTTQKRGPWSQKEDADLMNLVTQHGPYNWVHISQSLTTRTPKQCRERYHQNLKPNLNHTPISDEEGRRIEFMVADVGKRWAEIARRLGNNRSDNAVKNWWNGNQNRRRRRQKEEHHHPYNDPWQHDPSPSSVHRTSALNGPLGPIHTSPAAPSSTSPSSYYHQPYSGVRRPQWGELPLPSPSTSESAESDLTSNYTTSPCHASQPSPRSQYSLPPLQPWLYTNPQDTPSSSTYQGYHSNQSNRHQPSIPPPLLYPAPSHPHDWSLAATPRAELPTAPSSPDQHLLSELRTTQQTQHASSTPSRQSDRTIRSAQENYESARATGSAADGFPSDSKDTRLTVASLLSPS